MSAKNSGADEWKKLRELADSEAEYADAVRAYLSALEAEGDE